MRDNYIEPLRLDHISENKENAKLIIKNSAGLDSSFCLL